MQLPSSWVMVRLSAMGDVALTTGVLDYWHTTKGLTFTVLTREAHAPLFDNHPAVPAVYGLEAKALPMTTLLPLLKDFARQHKGKGLLDLHGTPRSRLLSLLWHTMGCGPVRRFPKLAMQRRLFLASKGHMFQQALLQYNVPQRYALALENMAPPRESLQPRLFLTEEEKKQAAIRMASLRDSTCGSRRDVRGSAYHSSLVALHPYSTHSDKAWHKDAWLTLMDMLDAAGIPWFVIGRGTPLTQAVNADGGNTNRSARDLTNTTTLRETCALLQASTALVTGDSGPMHLAAAVGTPVVALFGPTSEAWGFFPQGKNDVIMQVPLDCRPCTLHGKRHCARHHACMALISPQQVLDAVTGILLRKIQYK